MPQSARSGLPINTSSPRPINGPNLHALSTLSESSTGHWERGSVSNNARSPPTRQSILIDAVSTDKKPTHHSPDTSSPPLAGTSRPSSSLAHPASPFHPRQAREGYGFRPPSGQSTPTGSASATGFSPFVSVSASSYVNEEETDHRPDGRSMDSLREEVRGELVKNGLTEVDTVEIQRGTEGLSVHSGIADEQGLGWAGVSVNSCSKWSYSC